VSGGKLADGTVTVSASVTDDAGNPASATDATFDLDTTADAFAPVFGVSVETMTQEQLSALGDLELALADAQSAYDGAVATREGAQEAFDLAAANVTTTSGALVSAKKATADQAQLVSDAETDIAVLSGDLTTLQDIVVTGNQELTRLQGLESDAQSAYDGAVATRSGAQEALDLAAANVTTTSGALESAKDALDALEAGGADDLVNVDEIAYTKILLTGVDDEVVSVSIEITDESAGRVTVDAEEQEGEWVVSTQNLSGLADGEITVTARATDGVGNIAKAVNVFEKDTTADEAPDLAVAFIDAGDYADDGDLNAA